MGVPAALSKGLIVGQNAYYSIANAAETAERPPRRAAVPLQLRVEFQPTATASGSTSKSPGTERYRSPVS
jgi:hypothetical protein